MLQMLAAMGALGLHGLTFLVKEITPRWSTLQLGTIQINCLSLVVPLLNISLVLDEPAQGVDIAGQAELYALIDSIAESEGCGVLMICSLRSLALMDALGVAVFPVALIFLILIPLSLPPLGPPFLNHKDFH